MLTKPLGVGLAVTDALIQRGADVRCFDGRPPGHVRCDNGPEFVAQAVQDWDAANL